MTHQPQWYILISKKQMREYLLMYVVLFFLSLICEVIISVTPLPPSPLPHTDLYLSARWDGSAGWRRCHWETHHRHKDRHPSTQVWVEKRSSQPLRCREGRQAGVSCFALSTWRNPSTGRTGTPASCLSASWYLEVASTVRRSPPGQQDRLRWRTCAPEWRWRSKGL